LHSKDKKLLNLAFFTALAITIFMLENLLPRPLPFMKFGFANIIILYVLVTMNFRSALIVTVSKVLVGGLFTGLLISPTSLLSFCGSITSLIIMFILLHSGISFSLIGISISGAVSSNLIQLIIVRSILIKEDSIFYLTPVMIFLGVITGMITGYLTFLLIRKIEKKESYEENDL